MNINETAINTEVITGLLVVVLIIGIVIFSIIKAAKYAVNLLKTKAKEAAKRLRDSEVAQVKAAEWLQRQKLIEKSQIEAFRKVAANRVKNKEDMQRTMEIFGAGNGWEEKIVKTKQSFESLKRAIPNAGDSESQTQVSRFIVESLISSKGEPVTFGVDRKVGRIPPLDEAQFAMIVETILSNEEFIAYVEDGSIETKKRIMGHEILINVQSANQTITVAWKPKVTETVERTRIPTTFEIEGVDLGLDSLTKNLDEDPFGSIVGGLDDLDNAFSQFVDMDMNSLIDKSISLDGNFEL